jgi:hypothetical protein
MKRAVIMVMFCEIVIFGVCAQNRQTPIGSADLSNGGKISVMAMREVSSEGVWGVPEGMRLIAFDVFIDNGAGKAKINLNSIMGWWFEIQDREGFLYEADAQLTGTVKPAIRNSAEVEPSDILRGWVTFAITQSVPLNSLRFRLNDSLNNIKSGWIQLR